jgi:hypothetical protein
MLFIPVVAGAGASCNGSNGAATNEDNGPSRKWEGMSAVGAALVFVASLRCKLPRQ